MKWYPPSTKQLKLLAWWHDGSPLQDRTAIIADGAVRAGKTIFLGVSFITWAMENYAEQNFGIAGKTIGVCERNVITPLIPILSEQLGYEVIHRRQQSILEVSKGKKTNYFYIFGGKDESSQDLVQGITLAGYLFDEVALMPRSFVEQAMARCSVHGAKYWFNCNPEHPNHWFYKEWIQKQKSKNVYYIHFRMEDNPSLSAETIKRYEQNFTGVFYQRAVLGQWVVAHGAIYPMFSSDNIVDDNRRIPHETYYISLDYGTSNATSMGLWRVDYSNRRAILIDEYYHSGKETGSPKTDEEYADELERLAGNLPIQAVIVDPSAASFIQTLRQRGQYNVRGADNAVLDGIRVAASCFKENAIQVYKGCTETIKNLQSYRWDTSKMGDKPLEIDDHACDMVRYFVYTILRRELDYFFSSGPVGGDS